MSDRAPQYRNICFTINGDLLPLLDFSHPTWQHVKYCVYQREHAAHEHFQGYMELTQPKTFVALHQMDGLEDAHFEKRRGTAKQAAHYCMKPVDGCECNVCTEERNSPTFVEGFWQFGELSAQGQRADLLEIKRDIDSGSSMKRLWRNNDTFPTMVKYHRAFETYKRVSTDPRTTKPTVFLFIGPSGMGKTRTAVELAKKLGSMYVVPPKATGFWCDDYSQEDTFIIDEMNGSKMTPEFFNQLVDYAPMNVPSHGSAGHQFNSKYVFVCTNFHPKYWWKNRSVDNVKQTMRRIDVILKFFPIPKVQNACPYCAVGLCAFHHL